MAAKKVTVYHNPNCGTSRNVLARLQERGIEPEVVQYLKTPLSVAEWRSLIERSGLGARAFLRTKEKLYTEMDLAHPKHSDADLIQALADNPILLNRPVVAAAKGIRPCRPAETVDELL